MVDSRQFTELALGETEYLHFVLQVSPEELVLDRTQGNNGVVPHCSLES